MKHYTGNITPEPDLIFVFGSNTDGRHGAGSAKVAVEQFGAVYGAARRYVQPKRYLKLDARNSMAL